jgi:EAL domain-containing protein (putative c-di-GMP-specific phosphodiesterase class I)
MRTETAEPFIHDVISTRAVHAVYQPIVDLATGDVLGFESLARGPAGTALAQPDALFAAAARHGVVPELDRICRAAAVEGAARHRLDPALALFVNVEPAAMDADDRAVEPLLTVSLASRVIIEVTERMLCDRPAELLAFLARARRHGLGVALDDVGAVDESLALMPFVRPDVVKLDLRLVQQRPHREHARIVAAVLAYAEETGAAVLAEGIETEAHREQAVSLGATLGQGWYFGRPEPIPGAPAPAHPLAAVVPFRPRPADPGISTESPGATATPFDLASAARPTRQGRRSHLLGLSLHLEQLPHESTVPDVLISAFQYGNRFTPATARRYGRLAEVCALVAALGVDLPPEPAPGVRGAALAADDRLRDEWVVTVIGPHYAGALVARQIEEGEADPVFSFVVTHDRTLVLEIASLLLQRVLPL